MTYQEAIKKIEQRTDKEVIAITRVGIRGGRDYYAIDFDDNTTKDFYINLDLSDIEEA